MPGKAGTYRHHIPMKMHGRLGHARGARGEAEHAGIHSGGRYVVKRGGLALHRRFQGIALVLRATITARVEVTHRLERCAALLGCTHFDAQGLVAQGMADLRNVDDGGYLLGPQQGHCSHSNATRLDHAKPTRHHHGIVGSEQQHAIAGHQSQLVRQHIRDAIGLFQQVGVAPQQAGRVHAGTVTPALQHMLVQQLVCAIEALGKLQFGKLKQVLCLQLARRQIVGGKAVDVCGVWHIGRPSHSSSNNEGWTDDGLDDCAPTQADAPALSSSRAMMSCCTSVAPS